VTAGVFLLIRFNYLLVRFRLTKALLGVGLITMFLAGAAALLETDIKKIIALSTLRQLGVIIIILGAQEPNLAFFHLLSHAYFKAILFICAGAIIHNMKDFQDIRRIGRVSKTMPTTYRVIIVANLRLCGLPFLRGFYSKDLILETIIMIRYGGFIFFLSILATFFTVAYSCRISFLLGGLDNLKEGIGLLSDSDFFMSLGAIVLLPFSILGGINISWRIFSSTPTIFLPF
jgi:NADH-ubiquinone oxidoreductase chain 5